MRPASALQFQTSPQLKQTKPTKQRRRRLNRMAVYNDIIFGEASQIFIFVFIEFSAGRLN
jgi:hypothetical protein